MYTSNEDPPVCLRCSGTGPAVTVTHFLAVKPWNQSGKFPLCRMSRAWVPVNHLSTSSFRPPSDGSSWRSTADFISILTRLSAADQHGRPALCSDYLSIERSAASFDYFHLASLFWIVVLFQFIYLSLDFLLYLCIQFIGVPCPRSTCGGHSVQIFTLLWLASSSTAWQTRDEGAAVIRRTVTTCSHMLCRQITVQLAVSGSVRSPGPGAPRAPKTAMLFASLRVNKCTT